MLIGRQIREARELLGWSRADLARNTFLTLSVVEVIEEHGSTSTLLDGQALAIRRVCESAGIRFEIDPDGQPCAVLRKVQP